MMIKIFVSLNVLYFTTLFLSVILFTVSESEANNLKNPTHVLEKFILSSNLSLVQKWKKTETRTRESVALVMKTILPYALKASETLNLSSKCSRGIWIFLSGVKTLRGWAYKMLDASGKLPNGWYSGSIVSLGEYDQCLDVKVSKHFNGKYCLLDFIPPLPKRKTFISSDSEIPELRNITDTNSFITELMKLSRHIYHINLRTSICVPSVCSDSEIDKIAKQIIKDREVSFDVNVSSCEVKEEKFSISVNQALILALISTILFLCVCATLTDILLLYRETNNFGFARSVWIKCLLCFSFKTNTLRLMKKDDSPDSIKIFHGIKVITILWVILNHTYYYINFNAFNNLLRAREAGKEVLFQLIINGFVNVETFFFISAVLIAYGVMKMKQKKLNIFLYIFRRFWRLTPPFMFIIACVQLLPIIGSGPLWKETIVEGLVKKCQKNWWANFLYINNFLPVSETCLEWLWYIPVDTHLYLLSLIVLIPLKQNPRLAFILNAIMFFIGLILTASLNIYYRLHPTAIYVFNHPDDINYFVSKGYFRTYLHCSTYSVGICVGYFIATKKKFKLNWHITIFGWISAFGFSLAVLYGVYDWNQGNVPGLFVSTLYTCTNKLVWSLALGWVTIVCMTGNGGVVTKILSWQAFVPFARLTYMTYLVHPIIQFIHIGSTRSLFRMDHKTFLYMYLGNVTLAFMCAFGFTLVFESPFMALEKVFLEALSPSNIKPENKNKNVDGNHAAHELNENSFTERNKT